MKKMFGTGIILFQFLILSGCSTGVEQSPTPGTIRVTLQSNQADTLLIILGDTIKFSRYDHFNVISSQGRLYHGSNYADLYIEPTISRIGSDTINLTQRKWKNGGLIFPTDSVFDVETWNSEFVGSTIFEWVVPPGDYDRLEFSMTGLEILVVRPRRFQNPLVLPPEVKRTMSFDVPVTVSEGRVTEINLEILPFQSIRRYKDSYLFDRKITVSSVQVL